MKIRSKKPEESIRQQQLRWQTNLIISGMGVIALGIWTDLKVFLRAILDMGEMLDTIPEEVPAVIAAVIAALLLLIVLTIVLLPRFYVGFSAIGEGRGKKKRKAYMIIAGILAAVNAYDALHELAVIIDAQEPPLQEIAMLVIDLTLVFTLIDLIMSARNVRKLRTGPEKGEEACS